VALSDQPRSDLAPAGSLTAEPLPLGRRRRWRRPRPIAAAATLVVAGTLAIVLVGLGLGRGGHGRSSATTGPATVVVTRQTVVNQELVAGTLGYSSDSSTVATSVAGVLASVPAAGATLRRGAVLYRLDGRPVILLYGVHAAWRSLVAGMSGPDVRDLNGNLVALGYLAAPAGDLFTSATEAAVRRLQARAGAEASGVVPLGQVFSAPGAVRIGTVSGVAGQAVAAGATIIQLASARRVVTVNLDAAKESEVHVGDAVEIDLPNGVRTPGVVSEISSVATAPPPSTDGQGPGGGQNATIPLTIDLRRAEDAGALDQAPVNVAITTASVPHALSVPVNALVAQSDGTYAVEVVRPSGLVRLPVTPGLYSSTNDAVAVTASGLHAGDRVVIPG
jgi:peptidoglycan hydrolase-like protein with peptidoglycan-binding domain